MRTFETPSTFAAATMAIYLQFSTAGIASADETGPRNTIRWETASESGNFGYDIYRSPTESGPFERLTEEPIPGAGTTDLPNRYEYVDAEIEPKRVYWYYVESISLSGERRRFTPIYPSRPK